MMRFLCRKYLMYSVNTLLFAMNKEALTLCASNFEP